jgi:shikimate kinase
MGRIWLIGMMGSGKSTVAPVVASLLGWRVLDTDAEIVARSGRLIGEWFPVDLAAFRSEEHDLLKTTAASLDDVVVACGGGVVLDPESVAVMRSTGMVVCLDAPVPVLGVRVGDGGGRPLLGGDVAADLDAILKERMDLYRAAAHAVVPAEATPEEVAKAVVAAWRNWS